MISNRRLAPIGAALLALVLNFSSVWRWNHVAAIWIAVVIVGLYLFDLLASQSIFWIAGLAMLGLITSAMVSSTSNSTPGALVTLGSREGRIGDLILPQQAGLSAGLVVYFHNSGPRTAFRFNAGFLNSKSAPYHGMTRTRQKKDGSIGTGGRQDATIGDGADYSITENIDADWAERAYGSSDRLFMFPSFGEYEYCDDAGNYSCHLFGLWFQGPPFNRVQVMMILPCPLPPSGQKLPTPTSDFQYLPPCEGAGQPN